MKILKKKITRTAAFLLACILIGISAFMVTDVLDSQGMLLRYESYDYIYGDSVMGKLSMRSEANEIYDRLWLIGNMYLRNTDSSGKYTCSETKKKSIVSTLKERGLMNSTGSIVIDDMGSYDYYLSYNNRKISNTDISEDKLSESDYSFIYNDGKTRRMAVNHFDHDNVLYTTNYGIERYVISDEEIIIYDYDTTGLDYYIDGNNKFYYKTDGTTPMPVEYSDNIYSYNDYEEEYEEGKIYFIYDKNNNEWKQSDYSPFSSIRENDRNLKIIVKPRDTLIESIKRELNEYLEAKESLTATIILILPLAIAAFFLTLFVLIADGWNEAENKYTMKVYDKIWTEIPLALSTGFVILLILHFVPDVIEDTNEFIDPNTIKFVFAFSVPLLYSGVMFMLCSILRRLKCRCFWKTTFVYKLISFIFRIIKRVFFKVRDYWRKNIAAKQLIKNDIFTRRFILRLGICVIIESASLLICLLFDIAPLFAILSIQILAAFILLNFRDLNSIKKLSEQIESISNGDYTPVSVPENSVTYNMTNKLNNISDGIQNAVDSQIKSERMKIDLVTNVSHDLKTPLTSIISYIDLLSAEELSPAASDYVKVLEKKSARLKSIVSDLFDLAKATSNTDIKSEEIDAVILINQVIADMSDKIQKYGREIRTDIKTEHAPILAEGKKMYRVFQNLLDNALKYSIEGTRIYIDIYNEQNEVNIEIKNISAYEMKFTADEITERFVRGDESRTSEGNGLGLSIAKNFTEACGGNLTINIDGDVFSVMVVFPLI